MATTVKQHTSPYYLDIKFGEDSTRTILKVPHFDVQLNPIDTLYIILDIDRLLPSFRFKFQDPAGRFTHLTPFDISQNKLKIAINRGQRAEKATKFDFEVYRRFPNSDFLYDIEGMLNIKKLFTPQKTRGFKNDTSIAQHLTNIALNELKVDSVDISSSLALKFKNIVQPSWTNAELLKYLKNELLGTVEEGGFYCFIRVEGNKKVFVFKSLKEFYLGNVKFKFSNGSHAFGDSELNEVHYPILDYKVYDNYKIIETVGGKEQGYSYFDYDNSQYVGNKLSISNNTKQEDDFLSLTEYFSIDGNDLTDNISTQSTGRGNSFTSDFKGRVKNAYHKRLSKLSSIWITSWGLEDAYPGDIVELKFLENPAMMLSYQYNGFWMVQRVVHLLGYDFGTRLLLTRSGINTTEKTTLLRADERNRKR